MKKDKMLFLLLVPLLVLCENNNSSKMLLNNNQIMQIKLANSLNEISGICFSKAGRMFAHDDEEAVVYELDYNTGEIKSRFQVGAYGIEGDFEDIEIVNEYFYLLESNGHLYKFKKTENNKQESFEKIDLKFSAKYDLEGLCYDEDSNSLMITAKDYSGKRNKHHRAIYSYNLNKNKIDSNPKILIDLKKLERNFSVKDFYPSAITKNKINGNFLVLSSKGQPALVEIDLNGEIVNAIKLNRKLHRQPEGIAIWENQIFICDEADGKSPTLTVYNLEKYLINKI